MLCVFCHKYIPKSRTNYNHPKPRYCSQSCIKRAYYLRKNPETRSHLRDKRPWRFTETGKGRHWEEFACNLLGGVLQPYGSPFDIAWNGKTVDVKSASLYKRSNKRGEPISASSQTGWFRFDRGELMKQIDYFFCVGLVDGVPYKIYLIPGSEFGKRGVTITPRVSKYDNFLYRIK